MEKLTKFELNPRSKVKTAKVQTPKVKIKSALAYEGIYLSSADLEKLFQTMPHSVTLHYSFDQEDHQYGTIGIKVADQNESSVYEISKAYLIPCKDFISKVLNSRFGVDTHRCGIDAIKWEPNERMIKIHFWRLLPDD
jgi:hypothetical protein